MAEGWLTGEAEGDLGGIRVGAWEGVGPPGLRGYSRWGRGGAGTHGQ